LTCGQIREKKRPAKNAENVDFMKVRGKWGHVTLWGKGTVTLDKEQIMRNAASQGETEVKIWGITKPMVKSPGGHWKEIMVVNQHHGVSVTKLGRGLGEGVVGRGEKRYGNHVSVRQSLNWHERLTSSFDGKKKKPKTAAGALIKTGLVT